jgi:hypothetical protein
VPTRIPGRFRPRQVASVPDLPVSREAVLVAVQTAFPEGRRRRLVKLLDTYGVEPHERERERVQLAILKLCGAQEDQLRIYLAVAKRDYRDVLLWAEDSEDASAHTPEERRRMRELFERLGIEPPRNLSD